MYLKRKKKSEIAGKTNATPSPQKPQSNQSNKKI